MRSFILYIYSCFIISSLSAQDTTSKVQVLLYPYVNTDVGVSYFVAVQVKAGKKTYINIGGKYFQNRLIDPKMNNETLHHRFYASKAVDHLGLSIGLKRYIPWQFLTANPYIYYNLTYFNMDAKSKVLPNDSSVNTNIPVPVVLVHYRNITSLENGVGGGVIANITNKLCIDVSFGCSANFIFNLPQYKYNNNKHINLSMQYLIGLQYNF